MILVDSSVLLDVIHQDPLWGPGSLAAMEAAGATDDIAINDVIYAEMSVRIPSLADLDAIVGTMGLRHPPIPRLALFLAGKAFVKYRGRGGLRSGVLPDFFIGAHAAAEDWPLLTRDTGPVGTYFPTVQIIAP